MDNWCWAAVAVSVARFFNRNSPWRQCQLVTRVLKRAHARKDPLVPQPIPDCCSKPSPAECDEPWYLDEALKQAGRPVRSQKNGPLAFKRIQAEIEAGRPLCAWIKWRGKGAHFVVVSGWHISRAGVPSVDVEDPDAPDTRVSYESFVGSYRGRGRWRHTYLL